jgi:hypothetical protein
MNSGAPLTRYWFRLRDSLGYGVTAYSVEDARHLLKEAGLEPHLDSDVIEILHDVDIRSVDQQHVVVNMGPPNFRGVWYPRLNV